MFGIDEKTLDIIRDKCFIRNKQENLNHLNFIMELRKVFDRLT